MSRPARRRPSAVPRVVLDTNITVSALLAGGVPERIVRLARFGKIDVVLSAPLWHELARVLRDKFGWTEARISVLRDALDEFLVWVEPTKAVSVFSGHDEADNRVLEAALAGTAESIVTGDRKLLALRRYRRIPILTPRGFLDRHG